MNRILVPTASAQSAFACAEYIMTLAKSINAEVHVLHVVSNDSYLQLEDVNAAVDVFKLASEEYGIGVTGSVRYGDVAAETIEYSTQNNVNLIVMGASRGEVVNEWISSEVLGRSAIPVLVIPPHVMEFAGV